MASTSSRAWASCTRRRQDAFTVTPPSYRFDLAIEEDLIEEVARVYGFERIPAHPPRVAARMLPVPEGRRSLHALRERLAARDYQEVINFSFVEPGWEADFAGAAEPDPPAESRSPASTRVMRTSLIGGLVANVRNNHDRKVAAHPRLRGRPRLPARSGGAGRPAVGGRPAPADAHRRGGLRPGERAVGARAARRRFLRRQGRPGSLDRAAQRALRAATPIRRSTRGARRACWSTARAAGWIGELHPKWQQKYEPAAGAGAVRAGRRAAARLPLPAAGGAFGPADRGPGHLDAFRRWRPRSRRFWTPSEAEKPAIVRSVGVFERIPRRGCPG